MFNTIEEIFITFTLCLIFIYLITIFGSKGVKIILSSVNVPTSGVLGNGEKIGILERSLYFIGIISQNWVLISIVIGLKTISRFQKLDKQKRAEYFLIGSLASLLYSIIIGYLFLGILKLFKLDFLLNILDVVHNLKIL